MLNIDAKVVKSKSVVSENKQREVFAFKNYFIIYKSNKWSNTLNDNIVTRVYYPRYKRWKLNGVQKMAINGALKNKANNYSLSKVQSIRSRLFSI